MSLEVPHAWPRAEFATQLAGQRGTTELFGKSAFCLALQDSTAYRKYNLFPKLV